ncbi:hypothetical protein VPNG_09143 [Cytospora leucostoma]|uniref:Uncharacterized protein n=1 Tax=Cytospora leucostoma TaxID=1230097 RepID=A0A423VYG7_9PEZI|nr:hypothetical protein VPNG_09143 [Cytospora leucostoma]
MDGEKSTTPTGDRSRGVSIHLNSEAAQDSSSLPSSCQVIPAADDEEEGDDVRIQQPASYTSPLGPTGGASAGSTGIERDSMDDDYFGRQSGPDPAVAANIGRVPTWRRQFELNFSSSSPSSPSPLASPILAENAFHLAHRAAFDMRRLPPTYARSVPAGTDVFRSGTTSLADGESLHSDQTTSGTGLGTDSSARMAPAPRSVQNQRSYAKGPAVPPTDPLDIRMPQYASEQVIDASRATHLSPGHTLTSSSYPSISPLLPPPPSTMDHNFDLGQIMFPGGGAIDGGVRVVHDSHEHSHDGSGPADVQGGSNNSFDDSSTCWKRHTRVYGGGVCLACAAAGGGGFYGARVRPEDKR